MTFWGKATLCVLCLLLLGFGPQEVLVHLIEFGHADGIGVLRHASLDKIFEEREIQVTKFGSWQNLREVVLVVQDINGNILPQIVREVYVILVNNMLE